MRKIVQEKCKVMAVLSYKSCELLQEKKYTSLDVEELLELNQKRDEKRDAWKLRLTCLFLSSVIRWIWIFFLPMVLCRCGDKSQVSQVEKCLSKDERGSVAYDLLRPPKNSQTQSCIRGHKCTDMSLPRCGNVDDSFIWGAMRVKSDWCRDVWSWGVEVVSSLFVQHGQEWQTSTELLWWGGRHSSPARDKEKQEVTPTFLKYITCHTNIKEPDGNKSLISVDWDHAFWSQKTVIFLCKLK